ncbi:hypothetical protein BC826DRAFT_1107168 [Russula brevipes]|nr:hypothetical protein BC826DRAFT_1107168 [Russula brevipes]
MCEANWPAQERSTDAEHAPPKRAATGSLEGAPPQKEGVTLPREAGARVEGVGDVAASWEEACHIASSVANLRDFGPCGVENEGQRPSVVVAESNIVDAVP